MSPVVRTVAVAQGDDQVGQPMSMMGSAPVRRSLALRDILEMEATLRWGGETVAVRTFEEMRLRAETVGPPDEVSWSLRLVGLPVRAAEDSRLLPLLVSLERGRMCDVTMSDEDMSLARCRLRVFELQAPEEVSWMRRADFEVNLLFDRAEDAMWAWLRLYNEQEGQ